MKSSIILGTRGSKLALWQANYVQEALQQMGVEVNIEVIKTKGDRIQDLSFNKIEGKGFFTKEIEDALIEKRIDLAVHSMKDLPTTSPTGLMIAGLSTRANPADWLVIKKDSVDQQQLFHLRPQAKVGTSSARRKAQLLAFRDDIQLQDIRGNVPTRLKKLEEQDFDAIILAAAGLERLAIDLSGFHVFPFNPKEFIPAPAQGVLAYQIRDNDQEMRTIIRAIHDQKTAETIHVERKVLKLFDGGCQLPLGVFCERDAVGNYHVYAALGNRSETGIQRSRISYSTRDGLAEKVVEDLQNATI